MEEKQQMLEYLPYILCLFIIAVGIYGVAVNGNYFKKLISLGVIQAGAIMFFISIAKVKNATAPIMDCLTSEECDKVIANPLPHVLMLTAIVVGVAILAVGLSLIIRIKQEYKTVEDKDLYKK